MFTINNNTDSIKVYEIQEHPSLNVLLYDNTDTLFDFSSYYKTVPSFSEVIIEPMIGHGFQSFIPLNKLKRLPLKELEVKAYLRNKNIPILSKKIIVR